MEGSFKIKKRPGVIACFNLEAGNSELPEEEVGLVLRLQEWVRHQMEPRRSAKFLRLAGPG